MSNNPPKLRFIGGLLDGEIYADAQAPAQVDYPKIDETYLVMDEKGTYSWSAYRYLKDTDLSAYIYQGVRYYELNVDTGHYLDEEAA